MIRKLLRRVVDRALVGPRPVVAPREESRDAWTEAAAPVAVGGGDGGGGEPAEGPDPAHGLEVDDVVPGSLILDIREPGELASGVPRGAMLLPMDLVPHHLDRLPRDRPITVVCAAGVRSFGVAHWLREQGFPGAVSLAPGIGAAPELVVPPGRRPGSRVAVPEGEVDGAYAPAQEGELIEDLGGALRVRVRDPHGFWVERRVGVPGGG